MALKKKIEIKNSGVEVEYWKITQLNINWHSMFANCVLEGFLDKASRDAGKLPLDSRSWGFDESNFPFTIEGKNVEEAYNYIKTEEVEDEEGNLTDGEFKGAPLA